MEELGVDIEESVEEDNGDAGTTNAGEGEGDSGFGVVGGAGELDVAVEVVEESCDGGGNNLGEEDSGDDFQDG